MHAISSYRGSRPTLNTPTHTHARARTHRQDRFQYTAPQPARSVTIHNSISSIRFSVPDNNALNSWQKRWTWCSSWHRWPPACEQLYRTFQYSYIFSAADHKGWGPDPPPYNMNQSKYWAPKMSHSFIQICCWITLQVSRHQGWKTCVKYGRYN